MPPIDSPVQLLENHAALASRLLRTQPILHTYLSWLRRPNSKQRPPSAPPSDIATSIDTLLEPLLREASDYDRVTLENAVPWIASLCSILTDPIHTRSQKTFTRMISVAMLPLYRALSVGGLQESFSQTRNRFSEAIVLHRLMDCLELDELLAETHSTTQASPFLAINQLLQIDLTRLAYLVGSSLDGFEPSTGVFDDASIRLLMEHKAVGALPPRYHWPDWAIPHTLWTLSIELTANKHDLVLPRSWIDTPIPWARIAQHWLSLEQLLNRCPEEQPKTSSNGSNEGRHSVETPGTASRTIPSMPKILIGEVDSLDDPAFVNVFKHKVAVCRTESRSICVSMIVVHKDNAHDTQSQASVSDNGLSRWQQKLVNWLSDHPDINEPQAFVTRDGQLILAVMDCERNEMTSILREGLVEVLTGSKCTALGDLGQINLPARFHVGIGATTSPSASFDAKELISSAERCLSLARRVGSASIKSIEVF